MAVPEWQFWRPIRILLNPEKLSCFFGLLVGNARCAAPTRVQRAERIEPSRSISQNVFAPERRGDSAARYPYQFRFSG
jgi:hypothetical protein